MDLARKCVVSQREEEVRSTFDNNNGRNDGRGRFKLSQKWNHVVTKLLYKPITFLLLLHPGVIMPAQTTWSSTSMLSFSMTSTVIPDTGCSYIQPASKELTQWSTLLMHLVIMHTCTLNSNNHGSLHNQNRLLHAQSRAWIFLLHYIY